MFLRKSQLYYNLEEGGWKHQNWAAHDDYYAYYESQHLCDNRQGSLTFSGAQQMQTKKQNRYIHFDVMFDID